ncbi:hypothetical protein [Methylocella sp.]|uniref:hypothetical protein n=1 Tax=Methylocella sp. TaxID=1978226 RepID=UPI0035B25ACA
MALAAGLGAPAAALSLPLRSIREWATCDETKDSAKEIAKAFAAAKNAAFALNVDCPVFAHIGSDIARPIFIDDKTTVIFSGTGKIVVDNLFIPAFVLANVSNVTLKNWRIQYSAVVPVNPRTGGYYNDGVFISSPSSAMTPQAGAFNDGTLRLWLSRNRGVKFADGAARGTPRWTGPVMSAAIFHFRGTTANVTVSGLKVFAPQNAGVDAFAPNVFSFNIGPKNNQTVTASSPIDATTSAIPSNLTFSDIDFDGTYMGFNGTVRNSTFAGVRSHRYGDLQTKSGGSPGGVGKWFAPPHLFYLNYDGAITDASLVTQGVSIVDVIDYGVRLGVARDKNDGGQNSGNALSLKIGGFDILVDGYESHRPDGLLDLLQSEGVTIRNVKATYDSSFMNYIYPAIRFPGGSHPALPGYKNVALTSVSLADLAASTSVVPIRMSTVGVNSGVVISDAAFSLNRWSASTLQDLMRSAALVKGSGHKISFVYNVVAPGTSAPASVASGLSGSMSWFLAVAPNATTVGGSALLTYAATGAKVCRAGPTWSNGGKFSGGALVTSPLPAPAPYSLTCAGKDGSVGGSTVKVTYKLALPSN